ncbi:MAG: antitoxin Xre/MbcA/ParS toxin-binding domain-containing protein [Candidatus Neomarinimicrobiota bacterium]
MENIKTTRHEDSEKHLYAIVNNFAKYQVSDSARAEYHNFFEDKFKLNQLITSGLSYSLFETIQNKTSFTKDEWAGFLDISVKTLDRYKEANKRFKALQSEKIISMIEVLDRGVDVFGDMIMFKRWLYSNIPALSNTKPIELLNTSYGKDLILDELSKIEHGVFA